MIRRATAAVLAGAFVLASCGSSSGASPATSSPASSTTTSITAAATSTAPMVGMDHPDPGGAPGRVIAGPQGGVAQFVVECNYSHTAADDPIVFPGKPGASHTHVFFGNTTTDAASTAASLAAGSTTCDEPADKAAYWAPALLRDGVVLEPVKTTAYYRAGDLVDPTTVQPYPAGLAMIAGRARATSEQPLSVVAWACGAGIERSATPQPCDGKKNLRLIVTFPDCWDGVHVDSANHTGHMAYSYGGVCPADHPVPVPQLQLSVEYSVTGPVDGLELSSGGLLTGHADFFNGWDETTLAREVNLCLHRKVVCGVSSGRKSG